MIRSQKGQAHMSDEKILDQVEMDNSSIYSTPAGSPSSLICPECGGAIWEVRQGNFSLFQCHINHTFSADSFLEGQAEGIEHLLWTLLRTLKDRVRLTQHLAKEAYNNNQPVLAQQALQRSEIIQQALLTGEA